MYLTRGVCIELVYWHCKIHTVFRVITNITVLTIKINKIKLNSNTSLGVKTAHINIDIA